MGLKMMRELTAELQGERLCIEINGMGAARITDPGDDRVLILQMPVTGEFSEQQDAA
jgi:hypothetical protein